MSVIPLHGTWKRGDKLFKVIIWLHSKYEASLGYMSPKCRQFPEGLRLKLRTKPYSLFSGGWGMYSGRRDGMCKGQRKETNQLIQRKETMESGVLELE